MAYRWLQEILDLLLPELEDLPAGAEGEAQARAWFERLLVRFAERGLTTPAQQKNRVVDARNAIRVRFGDDHPSLAYVGFDEATWQTINLPTHDRTEARNEHQRLLRKPERIVARAAKLLESTRFEDLAVGLGLVTGRRMSELLDGHARFEAATGWSVLFTGQRKHKGDREGFCFEIPTLAPAEKVLGAWERLAVMLGDEVLDPQRINNRYGHQVNQAADQHFRGLIPPRLPRGKKGVEGTAEEAQAKERKGDALYLHLFRAVYATIAVWWFCPPRVNRLVFKAEIQGHRLVLEAPTRAMRRSYTAARHYDDYQVADATGKNLDGRQGIKLGKVEGVEVLRVFRKREEASEGTATPPIAPPPSQEPTEPKTTASPAATGQQEEEAATATALPSPDLPPAAPTLPDHQPPSPDTTMPTQEAPATLAPSDTDEATTGQEEVAQPPKAKEKKPRPVTYRIHPADRPRLDAFRTDPKQPQADNLAGVLDLLENAGAAIRAQDQVQAQLQAAQAKAEQSAQERDQARLEAQQQAERLQGQEGEVERLQGALEEAQTQAQAAAARQKEAAGGGGATVALAVVARELLSLATGDGCQGELQGRLISLATQALGTVTPTGGREPRQEGGRASDGGQRGAGRAGTRQAGSGGRAAGVEGRFFGPLFVGGGEKKGEARVVSNEAEAHATEGQEPADEAGNATVQELVDQDGPEPAKGAKEEPVDKPGVAPRTFTRRGGAAEKLEKALQAVVAHNEAQSSREKKWALTESSLARLTGCFRPAVRGFFAERAKEVEAHNQRHHLTPGHNAARGKKGERIEGEVGWREGAEGGKAETNLP